MQDSIPAYAPALQAHERASTGAVRGIEEPPSQKSPATKSMKPHGLKSITSIYVGPDGAPRNLADDLSKLGIQIH